MQKPQGVACFLVPADPHTPEAMHPTLRALSTPSPRLETHFLLARLGFFPTRTEAGGAATLFQELPHLLLVRALSQAQPLRRVGGRLWPLHGHALDGGAGHLAIIAMRVVHRETA